MTLTLRPTRRHGLCDIDGCRREYQSTWGAKTHVAARTGTIRGTVRLCDQHALECLTQTERVQRLAADVIAAGSTGSRE